MRRFLFPLLAMFAWNHAASAVPITLVATNTGWYDSSGFHGNSNSNYIAGGDDSGAPLLHNNFLVFNLTGVSGIVTSASLVLGNPNSTAQAGQNYSVYDVSTPVSTLIASNSGATGVYTDLGSGTLFGTAPTPFGTTVTVPLNASGLAALNSGLGGSFAFGGTLTGAGLSDYVFGFTNSPTTVQLQLDVAPAAPTPEPATLAAFGALAAVGLGYSRRRLKTVPVA